MDILEEKMRGKKEASLRELESFYTFSCKTLGTVPQDLSLTQDEKEAKKIIPKRNPEFRGPTRPPFLDERLKLSESVRRLPLLRRDFRFQYEVLNFIDGENSILDIRNAVSAEYEPVPIEWVRDFIELLARADVIEM